MSASPSVRPAVAPVKTPGLSDYTRVSRYALHRKDLLRRETWGEQISRVAGMHESFYGEKIDLLREDFDFAFSMMESQRVLGSQRTLQFGGEAILKKHARLYNCVASYVDRLRFFQECFWLLLCGCGTGFSVQRHHVASLPPLRDRSLGEVVWEIPDTIEGWADSVGVLMSSFSAGSDEEVPFPEFRGIKVKFDGSKIREKGAALSSGSKAPGPGPLLLALSRIEALLESLVSSGVTKMRPIHAYDIIMYASEAVLSGGVRRSATLSLFSADDSEMARAKVGPNWFKENPQRARSNNSALLLRNETTFEQFEELVRLAKEWGEPGFIWADSTECLFNPCVEIGKFAKLLVNEVWKSGWQACNLSTINGGLCKTEEEFLLACEASAILGTLQAGYTSFPYLGDVTEQIVRNESLLGVSITGLMESPDLLFNPDVLERGAKKVLETNERISKVLGIPTSARATCIKPEGTTSCLLDTASGIHPFHSRRGIRHVQSNQMEAPLQFYQMLHPHAVRPLRGEAGETTSVIAFPFEVGPDALTKQDVSAVDFLEKVRLVRRHWVESGTRPERCSQPFLRHNVSNTVHVKDHEWDAVARHIFEHREDFAGVSLLGEWGDKAYAEAPFVAVSTPEEQVEIYGKELVFAAGVLVDVAMLPFQNDIWTAIEVARTGDRNKLSSREKTFVDAWDGLVAIVGEAKSEHAVKDVWLWRRFCELKQNAVPVDWTAMQEMEDLIDHQMSPACAGGSCSVIL